MTREEQIAAFIANKGVTVCESTGSHKDNAKSLRHMRNRAEVGEDPFDLQCEDGEEFDAEREAETEREAFGAARASGFSVPDSLDNARDAVNSRF